MGASYRFVQITLTKNALIADVGCGRGMTVRWLRTQGYRNVWGIDREIGSFLPIQKENSEGLVLGDAYALPFEDSSMDVLLYECSLSIMDNPNQALREACRVLRTGGVLLISDFLLAIPLITATVFYAVSKHCLYGRPDWMRRVFASVVRRTANLIPYF